MDNKKAERLLPYAILLIHSFLLVFFLIINRNGVLITYSNLIIFSPFIFFMVMLPISWYSVYIINAIVLFVIYYINEFLNTVRGRPLNFLDLFCIKDGLRVASGYDLVFNLEIGINLVITILLTFAACFLLYRTQKEKYNRKKKTIVGIISLLISVLLVLYYDTAYFSKKVDKLVWDENEFVEFNGLFTSLYVEYLNSKPQKIEGYSKQRVQEILERYQNTESFQYENTPDAIYVIMNESLADYSLIGDVNLNSDPLKKIHTLNDNCFKGMCAVDVKGGSTCNTEFEFLTGCSLMYIPNTIPYVQFSLKNQPSIVNDLRASDYYCTAVHPFFGQEWKRQTVYNQLGFSEFISGELFSSQYNPQNNINLFEDTEDISFGDDLEYVRCFISDNECYKKMLEKTSNKKDFVFSVTMQNHSGYNMDFYDENMVKYLDESDERKEQYLNLTRISDEAFDKLLETLKGSDKKTVVLMFGDHQPNLIFDCFSKKYSEGGNQYQKTADEYIVPYILWANYDIEWDAPDFLSINYLSAVLKKNCNLPLTSFDQFRLEAMQEYPVITSHFSVDKNGEFCSPEKAMQSQLNEEYAVLQYNMLFDSK